MTYLKTSQLLVMLGLLLTITTESNAQLLDKIQRKVKNRVDRKIDKTIDKGLDKAEKGIDDAAKDDKTGNNGSTAGNGNTTADNGITATAGTNVNSKYDFVPGENLLFADDFLADNIGDFPARWNTNGSGEVVTLNGQPDKWLKVPDNTISFPETNKVLPENFTIEFDLLYPTGSTRTPVTFGFSENSNPAKNGLRYKKLLYFKIDHFQNLVGSSTSLYSGRENNKAYPVNDMAGKIMRVSISVNKSRIRLYLNQDKVFDLPRGFEPSSLRNNFYFRAAEIIPAAEQPFYVAHFRIAAGGTDLRSQLLTAGKVSTSGILFDVNTAKIKPASYGIIREIATALQENAGLRLKIIGHTDSDGADNANLDLSKRRAEAVKAALQATYGIDAARLQSDGKGESQPAADNSSPEGKARNRRVEFIVVK